MTWFIDQIEAQGQFKQMREPKPPQSVFLATFEWNPKRFNFSMPDDPSPISVHTQFHSASNGSQQLTSKHWEAFHSSKASRWSPSAAQFLLFLECFREKFGKFMRDTECSVVFMDAVCVNHCPAVRQDLDLQGLRRVPSAAKGHNVEGGSPPCHTIHRLSIATCFRRYKLKHPAWSCSFRRNPRKQNCAADGGRREALGERKYQKK